MKTFITFIILFLPIVMPAQSADSAYSFPVRPGTDAWKKLGTYEQMLNAYNVPNDMLAKMSTVSLVKTCLNYPDFRLFLARNSLQQGYDYIKSIFNGFSELEKRQDAGRELLKVYRQMKHEDIKQFDTPVKRGDFSFQFIYIELIMSQKSILANLTKDEKIETIKALVASYEKKDLLKNNFGMFGLTTSALVLGRLLDQEKPASFEQAKQSNVRLQLFVRDTHSIDKPSLDMVKNQANEYLKQLRDE
jgi:hypothetical protein